MARSCLTIILAAGEGTRMRSNLPKVLHPVAGHPMVAHVLESAVEAGADHHVLVVGRQSEAVKDAASDVANNITFCEQTERLGTAHAVLAARDVIAHGYDDVLVLFADTPLVKPQTLKELRSALSDGAEVAVLGFRTDNPAGYGRLIVENGDLVAIREDKDANKQEKQITFCNGGIMAFRGQNALEMLDAIGNANAKGEYYLTDLPSIARDKGLSVVALEGEKDEVLGVNNRVELAEVEAIWQRRRRDELMLNGVSMIAPETVFLSYDTALAADCVIEPNVVFGPGVSIGEGTRVRSYSHLEDCRIADSATVGPYARIRPGTRMARGSRVGNFCELKNAEIGEGAKVNHLSYVGDASVGRGANVGAGTITCNYDGVNKHRTEIGEGTFIGSNSALVAPVSIGDNAYVASGSVIVEDVPDDAMAVARGRQANKPGYAIQLKERAEAEKKARSKR
ncbi:MAG: bifunctional UDP-N-acetylglucosamine diphosphorylase/glucosamine-1-phosphate N-acetyltransferase GlmU [Pseudomonadota bacterium]